MKCPLCQQELMKMQYGFPFQYECPTMADVRVEGVSFKQERSHYTLSDNKTREWIFIPPYRIINYMNSSSILKMYSYTRYNNEKFVMHFKEIMSCPRIKITPGIDLLEKIKTILTFS